MRTFFASIVKIEQLEHPNKRPQYHVFEDHLEAEACAANAVSQGGNVVTYIQNGATYTRKKKQ